MQTLKHIRQKQTYKNKQNKYKEILRETHTKINTGHPAHHSTANKYLSGSGWMSCMFCFVVVFLKGFCCFLFTIMCSLIHAKILCKNTQKYYAKTKKNTKPSQKQTNTGHPPAHHSTANKYLSGSGWMTCIVDFFYRRLFVCFCCYFVFVCFCSLCKCLHV